MQEKITKEVILSFKNTFKKMGFGEIKIHPSYWSSDGFLVSRYHSRIDFRGGASGYLCLSLDDDFVIQLLNQLKISISKKYMLDVVAEISNILAGNLGKVLGNGFSISTPYRLDNSLLDNKVLLQIPIEYKNGSGVLIVDVFRYN